MRKSFLFAVASAALILIPTAAMAKVKATVNLATQRLTVSENGVVTNVWKISSGKRGHITPNGTFKPLWIEKMHHSKKYDNAPMPYSVFFHGGFAVHGTGAVWRLGSPASHGCVRLRTSNARKFYDIVKKHGKKNVTIKVIGKTRLPKVHYAAKKRYNRYSSNYSLFSWNRPVKRRAYKTRRPSHRRRRASNSYSHYSWF